MRELPSIFSPFHNEFNMFNNTGARMLDCIYHMSLKRFHGRHCLTLTKYVNR